MFSIWLRVDLNTCLCNLNIKLYDLIKTSQEGPNKKHYSKCTLLFR